MEALGTRRADLTNMESDGHGRTRLEYRVPARGLIGFQGEFMNLTRGTGLMSHVFDNYAPVKGEIPERRNGVLVSAEDGPAVAYALWKLQERGRMFVSPGEMLYEGMVIGIHSRDNDLVVNPIKGKQLTNVRASGTDEAVRLVPPIELTLEYAVEFIADDELVEVTPKSIRIRKRFLKEHERKKAAARRRDSRGPLRPRRHAGRPPAREPRGHLRRARAIHCAAFARRRRAPAREPAHPRLDAPRRRDRQARRRGCAHRALPAPLRVRGPRPRARVRRSGAPPAHLSIEPQVRRGRARAGDAPARAPSRRRRHQQHGGRAARKARDVRLRAPRRRARDIGGDRRRQARPGRSSGSRSRSSNATRTKR